MAMASAVRNLQSVANTHISMYKTDRFLADADWDYVAKDITVTDPYKTLDEEAEMDMLTSLERYSKCPNCEHNVPNEPSPKEFKEMQEEARLRVLKAEKVILVDTTHSAIPVLTLKVLVTTIDAQWEGMGDVGSVRYEPALLPPCPTIRVLSYSS